MKSSLSKIALGGAIGYVALVAFAYAIGSRSARSKAEKMLDVASGQINSSLTESADNILMFVGSAVTRCYASPHDAKPREIELYKQALAVDELCVVDEKGRFVCSTEPDARPGGDFDVSSTNRLRDYSVLLKGTRCVVEPVRGSVEHPDLRRKYGGVAFPGGKGFVQVGFDEKRLVKDFDYYYENVAVEWNFGELGYFIVADPATGRIVSTNDRDNIGKKLSDVAPSLAFSGRRFAGTKALNCFGEPCLVRDMTSNGHRVLTVLPVREVTGSRDLIVGVTALVCLVVFGVFLNVFHQTEVSNQRARKLLENEKAQAEKDLRMAKSIQLNAMPTIFPPYPKLLDRIDLYASMRTAKEVGGDFYDFYFAGSNRLALVIADVSGKGVPAAMFMMRAKTTLQGLLRGGGDIAEIVSRVNERLSSGNEANMFVTAWIGVVDLVTGVVDYVNAGHNPPVIRRASGELAWLRERSGPPLASLDGISYRARQFRLSPGDGIFLYTDGVTEATDAKLELFGENRLFKTLSSTSCEALEPTAGKLCGDVLSGLDRFVGGAEQADDITMLAFTLKGVEKSFPVTTAGLAEAQAYLEMFQDNPKPAIIMDEIVSNIVRCSGAHSFSTRFVLRPNGLEMTFADDGVAFDPTTQIAEPDVAASAEARQIGGLGIFMVKKMSKSVSYRRTDDGRNELTVLL